MKNKTFFKTAFISLTCLFLIYSCSKDKEQLVEQHLQTTNNSQDASNVQNLSMTYDHKYASNPFDESGQIHNDGLDYIRQNQALIVEPIEGSLISVSADYGVLVYDLPKTQITNEINRSMEVLETHMANNNDEFDLAIYSIINEWNGSNNAKGYMTALFQNIFEYQGNSIIPLLSTIKGIEDQISLDNSMNIQEKERLYKTASIMRHSLHYWSINPPEIVDTPTPSTGIFKKIKEWCKRHKQEIKIACADAAVMVTVPGPCGIIGGVLASISVS